MKIDRSFVAGLGRDRQREGIVKAVIDMAGALGIDVTAEGVETRRQAETLNELGCRAAQGFQFARPAPAEDIEVLLRGDGAPVGQRDPGRGPVEDDQWSSRP